MWKLTLKNLKARKLRLAMTALALVGLVLAFRVRASPAKIAKTS